MKKIIFLFAFLASFVSIFGQEMKYWGHGGVLGQDSMSTAILQVDSIMEYTSGHTIEVADTIDDHEGVTTPNLRVDNIKMYTSGHGIVLKDSTVFQNDVIFAQSASEFFIIHGDNDTTRFDMRENLYVLGIKVNNDTLFSLDSTGVLTVNKFGGNVIYVGSEENFEYNKVDDAINAASAGDVIAVLPGTYTGHIDADVANVKIIGIGGWKRTILNLTMSSNAGIDVTADNVVIDGFTLSGNAAGSLILLGSHPDSVQIQNCKFKVDGDATFGLNIGTAGSDYTIVRNNLFMAGSADGCFYGSKTITNLEMSYNEFMGQDSTSSYAIQAAGENNVIIKGNKIHGEGHTSGGFASGVFFYGLSSAACDSIYIEDNTISDCSKAVRLGHTSGDQDLKAVFITGNTLHDNSRGVYVANDANCYPATYQLNGNVFYNNTVDIRNDYSTALAAMSNFFEGYFETDELNVLDSLRNEGTELTKGLATFKGKIDADYAETATAADPTRYHDFRVDVNATQTASVDGLAALYGRIDWDKGDNSNALLHGIEGVASSSSADESITLRGGHFRTYVQANADAAGSTARTNVGLEVSARAGYSGGNAVQPESGTAFVGGRIWMAPYFATSVANINNFHGLWLYNEHPTYDITNGIYINGVAGGGSWTNFLNFRNNADVQMFGVAKSGELYAADSLTTATGIRAEAGALVKGALTLGTRGVSLTHNGDGAVTLLGLGNGADENVTIDLDSKADTIYVSSGTSANTLRFAGTVSSTVGLQTDGKGIIDDSLRVEKTVLIKGATRINDKLGIEKDAVAQVDISTNGAVVGLAIDGNKTTGNLIQAINDDSGAEGDSTFKVTKIGDVYGQDFYVDGGGLNTTSGDLTVTPQGDDVLLDGGLTVGSATQAGDNNLRVEGTSAQIGVVTVSDDIRPAVNGGSDLGQTSFKFDTTWTATVTNGAADMVLGQSGNDVTSNADTTKTARSLAVGAKTAGDNVVPNFIITGDADSDASAVTKDQLGVKLETAADPTLAVWGITLTQARGVAFTNTSTKPIRGLMSRQFSTDALGSKFIAQKARGVTGALTTVVTADTLGQFSSYGYDGTRYVPSASMTMVSTGTIGANRMPGKIVFRTATDAAPSVMTDRVTIDNAGKVGIGVTPAAALHVYNGAYGVTTSGVMMDADGNSGVYCSGNNTIGFALDGGYTWAVDATSLNSTASNSGGMLRTASTLRTPAFFPNQSFNTTGIGGNRNNCVSMISSNEPNLIVNTDGVYILNISSLGSESLNNTTLTTTSYKWQETGDFALTGNAATYTHSTGSGVLYQVPDSMAVVGVGSKWYKLIYTTSSVTGTITMTVNTSFACESWSLYQTSAGTYTSYFRSAASPDSFAIAITTTGTATITLDNVSLKQITDGDLYAAGLGTFDGGVTLATGADLKLGTLQWNDASDDSLEGSVVSANDLPVNRLEQLTPSMNVVTDANGHITTSGALAVLTSDSLEGNMVKANDLPVNRLAQLTPSVAVVTDANGHVSAAGALSVLVGDSLEGNLVKANDLPVTSIAQLTASKNLASDANGHLTTLDSLNGAIITARTIPAKSIVASYVNSNVRCAEVWVTSASQNPALVTLPANAKVLSVECWVSEAFTSDAADEVTIGYDGAVTEYATAIDVSSTGIKTVTLGATAKTVDATGRAVEVYYVNGGTEPGAGKAHVSITYIQCTVSP